MPSDIRKSPPVCLWISIARLIAGMLRLSKASLGQTTKMEDGEMFEAFRQISVYPEKEIDSPTTFIVRFKFSRLSHRANKITSIIPMLMISGYPGFQAKRYCVNRGTGYWMGIYQWESQKALEEYKRSFVFRMMNRRAAEGTVTTLEVPHQRLLDFIETHKG